MEDGDIITIDVSPVLAELRDADSFLQAVKNTLNLEISEAELEKRRKAWSPRPSKITSGTLYKYQQLVADASHGAITGQSSPSLCLFVEAYSSLDGPLSEI